MDLNKVVTGSFMSAGGFVNTGDTIEYAVGKRWYGAIKYAKFQVGRITGGSVVLMSPVYGDITVSRYNAITFIKT